MDLDQKESDSEAFHHGKSEAVKGADILMNFAFKMVNFAFKMMIFRLTMMIFVAGGDILKVTGSFFDVAEKIKEEVKGNRSQLTKCFERLDRNNTGTLSIIDVQKSMGEIYRKYLH